MVSPNPGHVFFEQTVFKAEISNQFLQCQCLGAQILHLACICLAGRITGQPLLAGLEEFLRPAVIQALGDPFLAAQLGNAVFATNEPRRVCRRLISVSYAAMASVSRAA